jgi:TPR repeat protein
MRLLLIVALSSTGCVDTAKVFDAEEPKQKGLSNSMSKRGARDLEQRKRDCYDFPSAHACYEVGLSYELGLNVEADKKTAIEYYDKACGLEKQRDHCEAAARLRAK